MARSAKENAELRTLRKEASDNFGIPADSFKNLPKDLQGDAEGMEALFFGLSEGLLSKTPRFIPGFAERSDAARAARPEQFGLAEGIGTVGSFVTPAGIGGGITKAVTKAGAKIAEASFKGKAVVGAARGALSTGVDQAVRDAADGVPLDAALQNVGAIAGPSAAIDAFMSTVIPGVGKAGKFIFGKAFKESPRVVSKSQEFRIQQRRGQTRPGAKDPAINDELIEERIFSTGQGDFRVRSSVRAKNIAKKVDARIAELDSSGQFTPPSAKSLKEAFGFRAREAIEQFQLSGNEASVKAFNNVVNKVFKGKENFTLKQLNDIRKSLDGGLRKARSTARRQGGTIALDANASAEIQARESLSNFLRDIVNNADPVVIGRNQRRIQVIQSGRENVEAFTQKDLSRLADPIQFGFSGMLLGAASGAVGVNPFMGAMVGAGIGGLAGKAAQSPAIGGNLGILLNQLGKKNLAAPILGARQAGFNRRGNQ